MVHKHRILVKIQQEIIRDIPRVSEMMACEQQGKFKYDIEAFRPEMVQDCISAFATPLKPTGFHENLSE